MKKVDFHKNLVLALRCKLQDANLQDALILNCFCTILRPSVAQNAEIISVDFLVHGQLPYIKNLLWFSILGLNLQCAL